MDKVKIIRTRTITSVKTTIVWFRKRRLRTKIFMALGLLLTVFLINRQVSAANAQPSYVTKPVQKGNIVQLVAETGNVNTSGRADVFSTTTGIIEEVYVNNNNVVETNQDLFLVRSTATEQEKATAYAAYQGAVSAQKTAEQTKVTTDAQMWTAQQTWINARNDVNYKNNNSKNPATNNTYTDLEKESVETGAVQSEKNFRALEKKVLEADVAINAAKSQVNSTWLAYQATQNIVVKSPTNGTITNLSVSIGDKVTSSAGTTTASPVLTIANLGSYSIKLALNEVDIPKVRQGQKAAISLDAFPGKEFRGTVSHVDVVGTNNAGVVTYNVVVTILNPNTGIRPGMTANIEIEVDKAENVLTAPNSAIKPYQGKKAVQIYDKQTKKTKFLPIEVGIKGTERTQIIKGVTEGTEVITALTNDQVKRSGPFGR